MDDAQREAMKDQFVEDAKEKMTEEPFAAIDGDLDEEETEETTTGFEAIDGDDDKEDEEVDGDDSSADDDNPDADDLSGERDDETIGQDLLFRAAKAGLELEDIKDYETPKALEAAIRLANKTAKTPSGGDGGQADENGKGSALGIGDYEDLTYEVPEDMDEEYAEQFTGLVGTMNERMKAQHEAFANVLNEVQGHNQQLQQAQDLAFARDFDSKVTKLGSEWEEVMGKGSIEALAEDSAGSKNRMKVFKEVINLRSAHPEWDTAKLFDTAVGITFPEEQKRLTVSTARKTSREHSEKRSTSRPSKRKAPSVRDARKEAKKGLFQGLKKLMNR
jgi:hypothetical protein